MIKNKNKIKILTKIQIKIKPEGGGTKLFYKFINNLYLI